MPDGERISALDLAVSLKYLVFYGNQLVEVSFFTPSLIFAKMVHGSRLECLL